MFSWVSLRLLFVFWFVFFFFPVQLFEMFLSSDLWFFLPLSQTSSTPSAIRMQFLCLLVKIYIQMLTQLSVLVPLAFWWVKQKIETKSPCYTAAPRCYTNIPCECSLLLAWVCREQSLGDCLQGGLRELPSGKALSLLGSKAVPSSESDHTWHLRKEVKSSNTAGWTACLLNLTSPSRHLKKQ